MTMRDGLTIIGEVDDASQEIVKQKLYHSVNSCAATSSHPNPRRKPLRTRGRHMDAAYHSLNRRRRWRNASSPKAIAPDRRLSWVC